MRRGLVLSDGLRVRLFGDGLPVSLLFSHSPFHIDCRVVSMLLGGTVSNVLSGHAQICMHESFQFASPHPRIGM
jgi:hypothetical protein